MKQISVDIKEQGGIYIIQEKLEDEQKIKDDQGDDVKDRFLLIRLLCFTMGLVHFVPLTFFTTANDYWMYKFRHIETLAYTNVENRTSLQSHFAAATTIATSVPLIIFILLTTTYGHYLKPRTRIYFSISIMLVSFIISTVFIGLNTDGWQSWFFVITMALISVINAGRAIYRISIFEIISKFPQITVAYFLAGEGLAGIFNSVLQIISLVIGTSTKTSALIYFISGCAVMLFSIIYFKAGEEVEYFKTYVCRNGGCTRKKVLSLKEIYETTKLIWSSVVIILFLYIAQLSTSPSITSLVVSENAGSGEWSDVYFVPVITFLLNNLCDFIGRTISSKINKTINGKVLTAIMILRMVVFVPFIMLCNAQPRNHLPVIFPHDYQYILIIVAYGLTSGYFFNAAFMSIPSLVPKEQVETAYAVLVVYVGLFGAVFSVLSFFCVDML